MTGPAVVEGRAAPVAGSANPWRNARLRLAAVATVALVVVAAFRGSAILVELGDRSAAVSAAVGLGVALVVCALCAITYRLGRPVVTLVGIVLADLVAVGVVVRVLAGAVGG